MPHLDLDDLSAGFAALPPPPLDRGRVVQLIQRLPGELRVLPDRVTLTCEQGVVGDRWMLADNRKLQAQVTMMRADVAHLMATDGNISRLGDNLFVELDLSAQNLPAGTRLRIGTVLLEVTPKPHTGCKKFM